VGFGFTRARESLGGFWLLFLAESLDAHEADDGNGDDKTQDYHRWAELDNSGKRGIVASAGVCPECLEAGQNLRGETHGYTDENETHRCDYD